MMSSASTPGTATRRTPSASITSSTSGAWSDRSSGTFSRFALYSG